MKLCSHCNINPCQKSNNASKFCSDDCRLQATKERKNKWGKANRKVSMNGECLHCSRPYIVFERGGSKYCSNECKAAKPKEHDAFSRRWEVLWRARPDLHQIMLRIESKVKVTT